MDTDPADASRGCHASLCLEHGKWAEQVHCVLWLCRCGSCWAFAATTALESAYYITKGTTRNSNPISLSNQHLVSCVNSATGYGSFGCE